MSLFQFGFARVCPNSEASSSLLVPAHMPTHEESGLGMAEYESTLSRVADHADPAAKKRRGQRGSYAHYSTKDKANIGKYALENGNIKAIHHFRERFPDFKESTVWKLKKLYKERLDFQRKQSNPKPVTEITPLQ